MGCYFEDIKDLSDGDRMLQLNASRIRLQWVSQGQASVIRWRFLNIGKPKNGWVIIENDQGWVIWGVTPPFFKETTIWHRQPHMFNPALLVRFDWIQ